MNEFDFNLDNTIDEDFFGSLKGKSSKLQQLFFEDAVSPDDKQQSLKYQPPKDVAAPSNAIRSTAIAKVVTAYRQSELQGKVGLALIQNPDNTCNIILYKTKTQILTSLKLQPGSDLLYKHTKYWQFYDEVATYWSFSFDTLIDEEEFVDKLCVKGITFKLNTDKEQATAKYLELAKPNQAIQRVDVEDFSGKIPATATKETKNSLIERMAKMGKPLPTFSSSNHQTTTEFSDSSDTEVIKTTSASTQKPSIVPRSNKVSYSKYQQLIPSNCGFNSVSTTANTVYPLNPLESQYMQMLLTEQRTQGSELRINMNKLENKIEKVLDKIELYSRNNGNKKSEKEDEMLDLEEKLLLLKKENRKLKLNLQENSSTVSEESKIKDLLYEFKEELNYFNIDHKQDLKSVLIELKHKLKETQRKQDEHELKLKEVEAELILKTSKNIELENKVSSLKKQENELKLQLNEKETEVKKQEQEVLELQNKLQQNKPKTSDDALVKSIMNNLFVDIRNQLNSANLPHSDQILALIASSIKQQTLQSLQQNMPPGN